MPNKPIVILTTPIRSSKDFLDEKNVDLVCLNQYKHKHISSSMTPSDFVRISKTLLQLEPAINSRSKRKWIHKIFASSLINAGRTCLELPYIGENN